MGVISVYQDNFEKEVLHSDRPVLLDFWAPWCGPCRMLSPVVEEVARLHPEVKVAKVNVDEAQELASRFGVMGIPSLFYLKDGKVISNSVGVHPRASVEAMLQ